MTQKRTIIDKDSLVPLSALGIIVGAAIWMSMLYAMANENAKKVAKLEHNDTTKAQNISDIKSDIKVIMTILKERNKK